MQKFSIILSILRSEFLCRSKTGLYQEVKVPSLVQNIALLNYQTYNVLKNLISYTLKKVLHKSSIIFDYGQ